MTTSKGYMVIKYADLMVYKWHGNERVKTYTKCIVAIFPKVDLHFLWREDLLLLFLMNIFWAFILDSWWCQYPYVYLDAD